MATLKEKEEKQEGSKMEEEKIDNFTKDMRICPLNRSDCEDINPMAPSGGPICNARQLVQNPHLKRFILLIFHIENKVFQLFKCVLSFVLFF